MGLFLYFSLKIIVTFFFAWASVTFSGVTPTRTHMAPKTSLTQDGGVLTVFIMVTSELLIVDKMAVTPMSRMDIMKMQHNTYSLTEFPKSEKKSGMTYELRFFNNNNPKQNSWNRSVQFYPLSISRIFNGLLQIRFRRSHSECLILGTWNFFIVFLHFLIVVGLYFGERCIDIVDFSVQLFVSRHSGGPLRL